MISRAGRELASSAAADERNRPRVVAVLREPVFSPGMVEHDAAILRAAAAELEKRHLVACSVLTVSELASLETTPELVLSMAEGGEALALLETIEKRGATVINAPAGVLATRRQALLALSGPSGPLVEGALVETNDGENIPSRLLAGGSVWVKRADYHALGPGDVSRVESSKVIPALRALHERGVTQAVVQPHLAGPVVKFYGVAHERPFFRAFPIEAGFQPSRPALEHLERSAFAGARAAGIEVFGGDAVFAPGKPPVLVDLNAWPSFWRCLADAAQAISDHAASKLAARAATGGLRAKQGVA
jgi:hypothetical protein